MAPVGRAASRSTGKGKALSGKKSSELKKYDGAPTPAPILFSTRTHEVEEIVKQPDDDPTVIREGILSKRIQGNSITWSERFIKLTPDAMTIGIDVDDVRDYIQLLDISDIWLWSVEPQKEGSNIKAQSVFGEQDHADVQEVISAESSAEERMAKGADSVQLSSSIVGLAATVGEDDFSQMEWKNAFSVHVPKYGRTYHLRGISYDETAEWLQSIKETRRAAVRRHAAALGLTVNQKVQVFVRTVFVNRTFQLVLSGILFLNYCINIIESESAEQSAEAELFFDRIDIVFTIVYMLELIFNIYGHWFWAFFTNWWSVFDLVIVSCSVVDLIVMNVAKDVNLNITVIRLLRIFRIIRVLGKLESLNAVVVALTSSIGSVANVFVIFWVILSIYAIIGTSMYADSHPNLFKKFSSSAFTMFQIATGDGWTDVVRTMSRDLTKSDDEIDAGVALYMVSFTLLVGIVVMNVVVAILLNGIVDSLAEAEKEKIRQGEVKEHHKVSGPMDPLLATLAHFTSSAHLTAQIEILFELLDVDDSQALSYDELRVGIQKMNYAPAINVNVEDWHHFTDYGQLTDENGCMSKKSFSVAIKRQLINYSQRLLAHRMKEMTRRDPDTASILFAFKMSMLQLFKFQDDDLSGKGDIALQLDSTLQRSGPNKSENAASGAPYTGKGKKLPSTLKVSGPESGDVNIKMTGTLKKRGLLNAAWKNRFFVLENQHLCYFHDYTANCKGKSPLGKVQLALRFPDGECRVRVEKVPGDEPYVFAVHTMPEHGHRKEEGLSLHEVELVSAITSQLCSREFAEGRSLVLQATSEEDRQNWMNAIQGHIDEIASLRSREFEEALRRKEGARKEHDCMDAHPDISARSSPVSRSSPILSRSPISFKPSPFSPQRPQSPIEHEKDSPTSTQQNGGTLHQEESRGDLDGNGKQDYVTRSSQPGVTSHQEESKMRLPQNVKTSQRASEERAGRREEEFENPPDQSTSQDCEREGVHGKGWTRVRATFRDSDQKSQPSINANAQVGLGQDVRSRGSHPLGSQEGAQVSDLDNGLPCLLPVAANAKQAHTVIVEIQAALERSEREQRLARVALLRLEAIVNFGGAETKTGEEELRADLSVWKDRAIRAEAETAKAVARAELLEQRASPTVVKPKESFVWGHEKEVVEAPAASSAPAVYTRDRAAENMWAGSDFEKNVCEEDRSVTSHPRHLAQRSALEAQRKADVHSGEEEPMKSLRVAGSPTVGKKKQSFVGGEEYKEGVGGQEDEAMSNLRVTGSETSRSNNNRNTSTRYHLGLGDHLGRNHLGLPAGPSWQGDRTQSVLEAVEQRLQKVRFQPSQARNRTNRSPLHDASSRPTVCSASTPGTLAGFETSRSNNNRDNSPRNHGLPLP